MIKVTAKRCEYSPSEITLKKGAPVTLEFTSLDRPHGFNCPDLGIRTDIMPEKVNRVHFVPQNRLARRLRPLLAQHLLVHREDGGLQGRRGARQRQHVNSSVRERVHHLGNQVIKLAKHNQSVVIQTSLLMLGLSMLSTLIAIGLR